MQASRVLDDLLKSNKTGRALEGGSRCFAPSQLVQTSTGDKPISEIKQGDYVKTCNGYFIQYKLVERVFKFENRKKAFRIKLKNGSTIEATEDHKFYFEGGWKELRHLVSLHKKRYGAVENNSWIQKIRSKFRWIIEVNKL